MYVQSYLPQVSLSQLLFHQALSSSSSSSVVCTYILTYLHLISQYFLADRFSSPRRPFLQTHCWPYPSGRGWLHRICGNITITMTRTITRYRYGPDYYCYPVGVSAVRIIINNNNNSSASTKDKTLLNSVNGLELFFYHIILLPFQYFRFVFLRRRPFNHVILLYLIPIYLSIYMYIYVCICMYVCISQAIYIHLLSCSSSLIYFYYYIPRSSLSLPSLFF